MQSAAGLGEGAYVCREYADLYVGADFDALWQQGLDVDFETMSFQSDYHTVFSDAAGEPGRVEALAGGEYVHARGRPRAGGELCLAKLIWRWSYCR